MLRAKRRQRAECLEVGRARSAGFGSEDRLVLQRLTSVSHRCMTRKLRRPTDRPLRGLACGYAANQAGRAPRPESATRGGTSDRPSRRFRHLWPADEPQQSRDPAGRGRRRSLLLSKRGCGSRPIRRHPFLGLGPSAMGPQLDQSESVRLGNGRSGSGAAGRLPFVCRPSPPGYSDSPAARRALAWSKYS